MKSVREHQCERFLIYDHDDLSNLGISHFHSKYPLLNTPLELFLKVRVPLDFPKNIIFIFEYVSLKLFNQVVIRLGN